jgi:hypothetical protein
MKQNMAQSNLMLNAFLTGVNGMINTYVSVNNNQQQRQPPFGPFGSPTSVPSFVAHVPAPAAAPLQAVAERQRPEAVARMPEAESIECSSESTVVEEEEILSSIHTDDSPEYVDAKIKAGSKISKKGKGKANKKRAAPNKKKLPTAKTMTTRKRKF